MSVESYSTYISLCIYMRLYVTSALTVPGCLPEIND